MSLECFLIVTQESKSSPTAVAAKNKAEEVNSTVQIKAISSFEYEMCETFIKNCVRTTFPEHR
jgi:hypothetical protein